MCDEHKCILGRTAQQNESLTQVWSTPLYLKYNRYLYGLLEHILHRHRHVLEHNLYQLGLFCYIHVGPYIFGQ